MHCRLASPRLAPDDEPSPSTMSHRILWFFGTEEFRRNSHAATAYSLSSLATAMPIMHHSTKRRGSSLKWRVRARTGAIFICFHNLELRIYHQWWRTCHHRLRCNKGTINDGKEDMALQIVKQKLNTNPIIFTSMFLGRNWIPIHRISIQVSRFPSPKSHKTIALFA